MRWPLRKLAALAEIVAVGIAIGVIPLLIGFCPRFLFANRQRFWSQFGGGMALGFMMIFFTPKLRARMISMRRRLGFVALKRKPRPELDREAG